MDHTLAERQTVAQLVATYQNAVEEIRRGFQIIAAAEDKLQLAFQIGSDSYTSTLTVRDRHSRSSHNFHEPEPVIELLKRDTWKLLVERLEVRRMMSIAAAKQLDDELDKGELPDITVESVFAMAQGFANRLDTMLEEAIEEVFNWLRPRHDRYKTNSQLEIGRRVILSYVVESGWGRSKFHVNYRYQPELTALENVFSALDGKGSITKTYRSALANAIDECGPEGVGETDYFRFRCYQNRNLHLEFKRLDLLEKFNQIAGGMRLRPKVA